MVSPIGEKQCLLLYLPALDLSAAFAHVEIVGETAAKHSDLVVRYGCTVMLYELTINVAFGTFTATSDAFPEHTDFLSVPCTMLALIFSRAWVRFPTLCDPGEGSIGGWCCKYSGQHEWEDSEDGWELHLEKSG